MLAQICLSCGAQNPATNRFCGQCGTQLERAAETHEQLWRGAAAGTATGNAASAAAANTSGAAPANSGSARPPHKFNIVIEPTNPAPATGSGFLGLSGNCPDYDDEERKPSHLLRNIAVCVVAAAAVLAGLQWRSIRDYGFRQFGLAPVSDGITAASPGNAGAPNTSAIAADNGSPNPGMPLAATGAANPPESAPPAADYSSADATSAHAMSAPVADSPESQSPAVSNQPATSRPDRTARPEGSLSRPTLPGDYEMARAAHARYEEDRAAWLWKAVAKGNPQASIKLASMYVQGSGVDRNCDQAQVLLRGAAKAGNEQAKLSLERIRLQGACPQ
jgi:hypothetical protein